MINTEKYQLSKKEIGEIQSLDLSAYSEFHMQPDKLCYQEYSSLFEKASPRQRGYIHGLCNKLGIDEYSNLPYYVKDIRFLTCLHAKEVIDILLNMRDCNINDSIF